MMARQAIRTPCPFVDIFERVSTSILRFFGHGFLLLNLTQDSSDRPKELWDPFAGNR
jgi:hypothetical protein